MDYLLSLGQTKAMRSHATMEAETGLKEVTEVIDSDSDELDLEELMS